MVGSPAGCLPPSRCGRGASSSQASMSAPRHTPEVYSHSRLSQFESCPQKFAYRYIEGIEAETESIEGFLGKRVHEVLERLYRFTRSGRLPTLERVVQRFRALWDEHYDAARVRVVREEMHVDLYRESGERCLENYYRRHYPFDADETLGVEERVRFSLDGAGRYQIQGVIDRIVRARDGSLEIHDYKTGARVPRQQQLDRDRQLGLYQLGLAERHGGDAPIRLVWHYLLSNQIRRSSRTREQLEALRAETMGLIDRIRVESEFAPRPGPLCAWCEYRERCPAQRPDGAGAAPDSASRASGAQRGAAERSQQTRQAEQLSLL